MSETTSQQCPFIGPVSPDPAIQVINNQIQVLWNLIHSPSTTAGATGKSGAPGKPGKPGGPPNPNTTIIKNLRLSFFVLVKWVGGSDGDSSSTASWTYDIYDQKDLAMTTKLNGDPVEVVCSRARSAFGLVGKAEDGSEGEAYYDKGGLLKLWNVQETNPTNTCDE